MVWLMDMGQKKNHRSVLYRWTGTCQMREIPKNGHSKFGILVLFNVVYDSPRDSETLLVKAKSRGKPQS